MGNINTNSGNEILSFIERYELLESEKRDMSDRQKQVMSEAKSRGYDTKILKKVIDIRKRDRDDLAEEEAILHLYLEAIGL